MRSWGWEHHGRPGGGQGGRDTGLRTRPRHGAPVHLVRLHGGHEVREDDLGQGGRDMGLQSALSASMEVMREEDDLGCRPRYKY